MIDKDKELEELLHKKRKFLVISALSGKDIDVIEKVQYQGEIKIRDVYYNGELHKRK